MNSNTSERGSSFSFMSESERIEAERGFQFLALCEKRSIGEDRRVHMERMQLMLQLHLMLHKLHITKF